MDVASTLFLNQPVPGESLAVKSGSYPYENPPLLNSPIETMDFLLEGYYENNQKDTTMKMIDAGVTLEYLVDAITTGLFINGIATVDVVEIIKPAFLLQLLADARDENIKDIKIFNNAKQNEFSDDDFSVVYQELRSEETPMTEMEMIEEPMPEQGSFLDMETS